MASHFRIYDSTPIEKLAMEYVILVEGADLVTDIFDDSAQLMERMLGRLDRERIDALIERQTKAYYLINRRA